MSKHDVLTIEELEVFKPTTKTIHFIDNFLKFSKKSKKDIKILDWGCSRGLEVFWLKRNGYESVYGVDIDMEPIKNGLILADELDMNGNILSQLIDGEKTKFPDNYFDIVFSNQVLEHVKDIDKVAAEIYRITKPKGVGCHIFPGFLYPNEGHLHMPFVHWLPKNFSRYSLIILYVFLRREPFWPELKDQSIMQRAKVYYSYSINKTYYRSPWELNNIFKNVLFNIDHVNLGDFKIFDNGEKSYFRGIKQFFINIFFEDELFLQKY